MAEESKQIIECKDCEWWPNRYLPYSEYTYVMDKYPWCKYFRGGDYCSKAERANDKRRESWQK